MSSFEAKRHFEERIIDHNVGIITPWSQQMWQTVPYLYCNENSQAYIWLNDSEIIGRNYSNRGKREK